MIFIYLQFLLLFFVNIHILIISSKKLQFQQQPVIIQEDFMAHFVQTQQKLQPKLVLSIPCRQIVMPRYRRLLRQSSSVSKLVQQQISKQHYFLKSLCDKLTQKQLKRLQIENDFNLRKKFRQVKKKLRNEALSKQKQSQVLKYFEGKDDCQDLSTLMLNSGIKNVQLGIKYQTKLTNKLMSIKQVSQIDGLKNKYRSWLNTTNNSPLNSPNYNKMNFVIEKVNKNKQLTQIFQNQQSMSATLNIKPKQRLTMYRQIRTSDKSCNPAIARSLVSPEYSPKTRCPITRQFHEL